MGSRLLLNIREIYVNEETALPSVAGCQDGVEKCRQRQETLESGFDTATLDSLGGSIFSSMGEEFSA
jgi:hypothetical protein